MALVLTTLLLLLTTHQPVIDDEMSIDKIQEAIREYIIEDAKMTNVRMPAFVGGDITYSSGNPVYDGGADLGTTEVSATWYGNASVAAFCAAGRGVRYAFTTDSQGESGPARMLVGMVRTHEITYSRLFASVGSNDPVYMDMSGGGDIYQANQWTLDTETSTGTGKTVAQIYTDEGLGDPTQIPLRWGWSKRTTEGNQMLFSTLKDVDDAQPAYFFDGENFDPVGGVKIKQKIAVLIAGSSDAPDEIRFRQEYYDNTPTLKSEYKDYASLDAVTGDTVVTLNATNNSAKLIMVDGDVKDSYPSQGGMRPRASLYKDTELFNGKTWFTVGGIVQRYESDGVTEEDNTSICLVRSATSRNAASFLHGATLSGLSNDTTHGGDRTVRAWMWKNFDDPNVLVYSFGHNNTFRTGTGFKAESVTQADLYDLIVQDAFDYFSVHSEWPRIIVVCPWKGGSMDDTRHGEMMGIVDGLNGHGIPTLGISLYNHFGGSSFSGLTASDGTGAEPWKNATTFKTDSGGAGVHPNSSDDAYVAWYPFKTIIDEAAATHGSRGGNSSRKILLLKGNM